jgi:hypothetical protein
MVMRRFLLLMHDDTTVAEDSEAWGPYLSRLRGSEQFDGGSSIGVGSAHQKDGVPGPSGAHLVGYLLVRAADVTAARLLLDGNPVYEAGGTVEIRELVED